jgi:hypothetical protein
MRTFLIAYDLAKPHRNKHVVAQAIMGLGQSWARPLEQTWYVRADALGEEEIETRLAGLLDADDGLLIQACRDDAVMANTSLRWFRQRRPAIDIDGSSNIIAFPVAAQPAAQAELPLAQAS